MFPNEMQTIQDFQAFHRWLDEKNSFDPDILFNMVLLSSEVGEVAQVLKKIRRQANLLRHEQEPGKASSSALVHRSDSCRRHHSTHLREVRACSSRKRKS